MATYIVIEVAENENALDIMNVLMTQTNARFTITKEIGEYAAEREQLKRAKTAEKDKSNNSKPYPEVDEILPPPKKKACPEQPPDEPEQRDPYLSNFDFSSIVPKTEEPGNIFQNLMESGTDWYNTPPIIQQPTKNQPTISEMLISASTSQPPDVTRTTSKRQNDSFQCHMCGAMIKAYHLDYYKRSNHAIIHTSLQRYLCPVKDCGAKTRHRSNMVVHARTVHGLKGRIDVENCLLPHEDDELKQTVINCFPEMEETIQNMQKRERMKNTTEYENGAGESDDDLGEEQ